jgi:hypothetical protein
MIKNIISDLLKHITFDQKNHIIKRFQKSFNLSVDICENLFIDCILHIWVSNKFKELNGKSIPIVLGQEIIDEMWHNFILFTPYYSTYCDKTYGKYVHHIPESVPSSSSLEIKDIEMHIKFIEKYLGRYYAERWYIHIPSKYTKTYISSITN